MSGLPPVRARTVGVRRSRRLPTVRRGGLVSCTCIRNSRKCDASAPCSARDRSGLWSHVIVQRPTEKLFTTRSAAATSASLLAWTATSARYLPLSALAATTMYFALSGPQFSHASKSPVWSASW